MNGYIIKNGRSFYTFKSGLEVAINHISGLEGNLIDQMFYKSRPKPPVQMVLSADGVNSIPELKEDDPEYIALVNRWEMDKEEAGRHLLICEGIDYELNSAQINKVDQKRAFWKNTFNQDLDPDDKYVYFSYFEIHNQSEYSDFADAILSRSEPTEAAIAGALESFQNQGQG